MLAEPSDWSVHVNELRKRGGLGRDKTYSILKRLTALRYIHRCRQIDPKTGQYRGFEYEVWDAADAPVSPENLADEPRPDIQETGISDASPVPDLPYAANQDALIKQTYTKSPSKRGPQTVGGTKEDENAHAFTKEFANWPVAKTRSQGRSRRLWLKLQALEREQAADGIANYLA